MKRHFFLNSLKVRYSILTAFIACVMIAFSWYAQNQVSQVEKDIQTNIKSRESLFQENREIRADLWKLRDLLSQFQVDPGNASNPEFTSKLIAHIITRIKLLSSHSWLKKNYQPTLIDLTEALHDFDVISQKMIKVRLNPTAIFPSLKIASDHLEPLNSQFIEKINLAIKEIEDNYEDSDIVEYRELVSLRYYWLSMITHFRMYLMNRFNSFAESFLQNQLHNIDVLQDEINQRLIVLNRLNRNNQLEFSTTIALEKINLIVIKWNNKFHSVKQLNQSEDWRTDTVIFHTELEPKLNKIYSLLKIIDQGIEQFSQVDLDKLYQIARFQLHSIWIATIVGLILLMIGFIFLVKTILNPISAVTNALKDSQNKQLPEVNSDNAIHETKSLLNAFSDMREQIQARQVELEYTALHDSLTGLANRELLHDRMEQAVHNAIQDRGSFAVLIMDLNRFKEVNDTLGHAVGDKLLQEVAQRLLHLLREVDVVVRLGGDEFAVLLETASSVQAEHIARKIIKDFESVFNIDDIPLYIGISIGIAVYPQHGTSSQILQQRADVAMYVAKRNKSGYEIYNPKFDEHSVGKLSLISDLRNAIDNNELYLKYQPIINLKTGQTINAEALLRWRHPTHGEILPDEIIPIAEQTGLINPITYWVIDTTSRYIKHLQAEGIDIKIAINLSVYNLQDSNFIDSALEIIKRNNIPPSTLIMEVTESAMMTNPKKSIEMLNMLNNMGINIAVDDYGTGYSSLSYLKSLPLSKLKIDKSFILDMIEDDNDAMIVRSTIDLAHNLGMKVVAEGIENREIMELLMILGCDHGQGYYISHPVEAALFETWIQQNPDNIKPFRKQDSLAYE